MTFLAYRGLVFLASDEEGCLCLPKMERQKNIEFIYTSLYSDWKSEVYNFVLKRCRIPVLAEDIVQEVFLKAWEKRATLPDLKYPLGWLLVVARNVLINYSKKDLLLKKITPFIAAERHYLSSHDILLEKEYRAALQSAIRRLPKRQKQVFELKLNLNLKTSEIATILNIFPLTVKNILHQAKASVKQDLLKVAA